MEMPQPTDAHRKLERLAGSWVGEETMHPSPWDPAGGVATGRRRNRVGLNGLVVIGDYRQERDGKVTFEGHGVHTYDAKEGEYMLYWFDSFGGGPEQFRGSFDGDILTLTSRGKRGQSRMTDDLSEEGRIRSRMEMSTDGVEWKALFDASYVRED